MEDWALPSQLCHLQLPEPCKREQTAWEVLEAFLKLVCSLTSTEMFVSSEIWIFLNKVLSHSCVCKLWLGHNWARLSSSDEHKCILEHCSSLEELLHFSHLQFLPSPTQVVQFVYLRVKLTSMVIALANKVSSLFFFAYQSISVTFSIFYHSLFVCFTVCIFCQIH